VNKVHPEFNSRRYRSSLGGKRIFCSHLGTGRTGGEVSLQNWGKDFMAFTLEFMENRI